MYLFTTFPKSSETFLQREVLALSATGVKIHLYSLFRGGGEFAGMPVQRFSLWRLVELIWVIPIAAITRWDVFGVIWRGLWTRRAPSWLNFWENMLGAAFGGLGRAEMRRLQPNLIHAAWGGAPATAAWLLHRFDGHPYSAAAHAYDIYEHGGDWWLDEKLSEARFVHTSTEMARDSLIERGLPPSRIVVSRRGLNVWPAYRPLRSDREELRLVSIGRLVEKKGFDHQLRIYRALVAAGVKFRARIVGDGPGREQLDQTITELDLRSRVTMLGAVTEAEIWRQLSWADVLLHTGVVAYSGDRDGLPNVIPEAMAAGVVVMTSPAAATTEAVTDGVSGRVLSVTEPALWVEALREVAGDDAIAATMRDAGRQWVESEYDAKRNVEKLRRAMMGEEAG